MVATQCQDQSGFSELIIWLTHTTHYDIIEPIASGPVPVVTTRLTHDELKWRFDLNKIRKALFFEHFALVNRPTDFAPHASPCCTDYMHIQTGRVARKLQVWNKPLKEVAKSPPALRGYIVYCTVLKRIFSVLEPKRLSKSTTRMDPQNVSKWRYLTSAVLNPGSRQ